MVTTSTTLAGAVSQAGIPLTKASDLMVGKSCVNPPDVTLTIQTAADRWTTYRFKPSVAEALAKDLLEEARRV